MFVGFAFITPSVSYAQVSPGVEEQRIELINQLIAVLTEKLEGLIAQLNAQQVQINELKTPVLGSAIIMPTFEIDVTTEFGSGSWENYEGGDDFLDGRVRFTLDKSVESARITYYPTSNPSESVTSGALYQNGAIEAGYFQPETEYHWSIEAVNDSGQKAHVEDTFTTGKY